MKALKKFALSIFVFIIPSFCFSQNSNHSCTAAIKGHVNGSEIKKAELLEALKIDLPIECNDSIISYTFSFESNGAYKSLKFEGPLINAKIKELARKKELAGRIIFEDIKVFNVQNKTSKKIAPITLNLIN